MWGKSIKEINGTERAFLLHTYVGICKLRVFDSFD